MRDFRRQKMPLDVRRQTTICIVAGLRAVPGAGGAHGEHMRKTRKKSNINSEPRSKEEAHIPANRTVSG